MGIDYDPEDDGEEVMRKCAHPPCSPLFGKIGDDCFKPCGSTAGKCFDPPRARAFAADRARSRARGRALAASLTPTRRSNRRTARTAAASASTAASRTSPELARWKG